MAPNLRRAGRLTTYLAWLAVAGASSSLAIAQSPPATAPTSAGPGLPTPVFSSIGPGLGFSHSPSPDPADKDDVEADQATVGRLSRQIPNARITNLTLEDAFGYIRDLTDLTINVNWDALHAAGVEKDVPIALNMKSATVGGILEAILATAQNGRQVVDYEIQHGALTVDTVANLNKIIVTRSYDVTAALAAIVTAQTDSTGGVPPSATTVRDEFVKRVRDTVAAGASAGTDDKAPSVVINDADSKSTLVVVANLRTQRGVSEFLDKLHQSNPSP